MLTTVQVNDGKGGQAVSLKVRLRHVFGGVLAGFLALSGVALSAPSPAGAATDVQTPGYLTTFAGNGSYWDASAGPSGTATSASLGSLRGLASDSLGNVYISDVSRAMVEKVSPNGQISVVAGGGFSAPSNGYSAVSVALGSPQGLATDYYNNVYIADSSLNRIFLVTPQGTIFTVAGSGAVGSGALQGSTSALTAGLNGPSAVTVSSTGTIYIADTGNQVVEAVKNGMLSVITGTGVAGSPTEGLAVSSKLATPLGLALDSQGTLYIACAGTYQVVKVLPNGYLVKVAGTGISGAITEGALATQSKLNPPRGLALDSVGDLYINLNGRIARVDPNGNISTFAGGASNTMPCVLGGVAAKCYFGSLYAVAVGPDQTVYIADDTNRRVYSVAITPGAPSQVSATASGTSAYVQFNAPSSNSSAPTAYQATSNTVIATDTGSLASFGTDGFSSPIVVSGLTTGHTYTFRVIANNAFGSGPASAASSPFTLLSAPQAPTNVTVQVVGSIDDASAFVSFTPPADNGGANVTSYTVTAHDQSSPGSPSDGSTCVAGPGISSNWYACLISQLTYGDTYTFTVTATSAGGTSVASVPSAPAVPTSTPSTVTDLQAWLTDSVGTVQVHFTPPNLHGEALAGYIVGADGPNGAHASTFADASGNARFTNLAVGSWTFREITVASPTWSADSNIVVVNVAMAPGAPTSVVASTNGVPTGSAYVSYAPSEMTGGASTYAYRVLAHDLANPGAPESGQGCVAGPGYSPTWTACMVTGLLTGHHYTFTVVADYSIPGTTMTGSSSPGTSEEVAIAGPPSAPQQLNASAGDASATVTFSAPADDGGSPVVSYTVTAQDVTNPSSGTNGATCQVSGATNSLSCTISGLTNGDAYGFTATATNSAYTSVASLSTGLVTPEPFAANIAVVAQSKKLQVSWTPSSEGAIDSYLVSTVSGDGTICTTTETTCTISWLKNGVTQVIQIDAYDDQGNLLSSVLSDPVAPAGAPLAPLNVTAVAGNRSATISWSAASAQGSAVTTYTVTDEQGNSCSTETLSCTISQLVPGANDAFFVTATNGVGTSPLSVSSNIVVISATPSAPQGVTVTPKLSSLLVSWSASLTNGGSEISKYLVTDSFGNTCMTDQTSCVLSGQSLVNSAIDTVTVVGVNLDGLSSESSAPVTGVTGSLPDAPTGLHAYGGKNEVYLEWTAPFFRGGVPIQNYTVVVSNGQSYTTESTNYLITELDGGIGLGFQVFANNEFGSSLYSASADAMAVDVPTAPTGVVATAQDNGSVVVQFNASSGRGLSVDHYTVSDGNGHYCETTSTSCTVSGLSLGHTYRFNVVATNGRGDSAKSLSSVDVLAAALPEAPHDLFVTGGNHSVLISWQAGADNGSTISSYKVSSIGLAGPVVLCQTSQTSCAIGGLNNGAPYQFTVKATNGVGTSDASTLSPVVVPAGVPNSPTNLTAVVGDGSVTLSWTGSSTNGTPVTSYTVSANDGSSCDTPNGEQTTCAISGLTNGQTYSFYVVANSLAGSSLGASVRATPIGVPTAPQQVSVVAGNGSAVISFGPPAFNGGSIVTRYVASDGFGDTCWKQAAGSCRISGLTNGQNYTFAVVAINAAGPSTAVSVQAMPAGPPSRPTGVIAQAQNGKALVVWMPPADNGSPVLSYTVTSSAGQSCTSTTSSCTVSGLRNGESYFFIVKATNALGTSNPSAASNEVTPSAPPTAPQNLVAVPGDGAATFSWNAPQNTNGAAVTSYRVTNGVNFCETTSKTCTVTGLTNGQASVFRAYAQNAAGPSIASPSVQVVPATTSGAPTISSVTSIATGLEVAFVPPTVNGGAPVTSYLVSVNGGATFAAVASKSLTGSLLHLTGLTAGSTYSVALKAVNSAGASSRSEAVSATYVTTASSPKIISVNSQKTSVVVNYAAPSSTGGTPIVAYQYSLDRGVTWNLVSYGTPTKITITGLLRHKTYRLQLRAVNSAGIGSASSVKVVRTA